MIRFATVIGIIFMVLSSCSMMYARTVDTGFTAGAELHISADPNPCGTVGISRNDCTLTVSVTGSTTAGTVRVFGNGFDESIILNETNNFIYTFSIFNSNFTFPTVPGNYTYETTAKDKDNNSMSDSTVITVVPSVINVSFYPNIVTGGTYTIGYVTLYSSAPIGGVEISLTSNCTDISIPSSITVPGGQSSTSFFVATNQVASQTTATIAASSNGIQQTANFVIEPIILLAMIVSPGEVAGGDPSMGTVTLNGKAPAGGLTVALSSGNTAAAIPTAVTIPVGQSWTRFPITTTAVTAQTVATITGTLNGVQRSADLTLTPLVLESLSLEPSEVAGGDPSVGTVTLNGKAPAGGLTVTLSSGNAAAAVPVSAAVAEGQSSATFPITTTAVTAQTVATITGTLNGVQKVADLLITPTTARPPDQLRIVTEKLLSAESGTYYSSSITAEGGVGDYSWFVDTEDVSPGFVFENGDQGYRSPLLLIGIPSNTGDTVFTVKVYDEAGNSCAKKFSINVANNNKFKITSDTKLPSGYIGKSYSYRLEASNGMGDINWSITSGNLPLGMYLTEDGVLVQSYYFRFIDEGLWYFTVQAVDFRGYTAIHSFCLFIADNVGDDTDTEGEIPFAWDYYDGDGYYINQWNYSISVTSYDGVISMEQYEGLSIVLNDQLTGLDTLTTQQLTEPVTFTTYNGSIHVESPYCVQALEKIKAGGIGFQPNQFNSGYAWVKYSGNPSIGALVGRKPGYSFNIQIKVPSDARVVNGAQVEEILQATKTEMYHAHKLWWIQRYAKMNPGQSLPLNEALWSATQLKKFNASLLQVALGKTWDIVKALMKVPGSAFSPVNGATVFKFGPGLEVSAAGEFVALENGAYLVKHIDDVCVICSNMAREGQVMEKASEVVTKTACKKCSARGITVKGVFKLKGASIIKGAGGVFLIIGLYGTAMEIYHAEDKVRAVVTNAAGWAGAAAGAKVGASGAAAACTFFEILPGPGTVGHVVCIIGGAIIGGGIGYFVAEKTTGYIYDLVIKEFNERPKQSTYNGGGAPGYVVTPRGELKPWREY